MFSHISDLIHKRHSAFKLVVDMDFQNDAAVTLNDGSTTTKAVVHRVMKILSHLESQCDYQALSDLASIAKNPYNPADTYTEDRRIDVDRLKLTGLVVDRPTEIPGQMGNFFEYSVEEEAAKVVRNAIAVSEQIYMTEIVPPHVGYRAVQPRQL